MSSQRSSRLQLPKKPKCVSAPARASKRELQQIDEATRLSLKSPAASVGAQRHGNGAGATPSFIGDLMERRPGTVEIGAQADSGGDRTEKKSPASFAVHLDDSPASAPEESRRSRTASKKRQLLEDSEDDENNQKGKGSSGSEQSAGGESGDESGSEFSGEESESSEDADSDVADSEEEEAVKAPAKKSKQVKAKAAAPKPKAGHKRTGAASGPAKTGSAAARTAQASASAARSGPAAKAQQPSSGGTSHKGAAAQQSGAGAKAEGKQPLQPRIELNAASTPSAAPSKHLPLSKGAALAAPAAAARAAVAVSANSGNEQTPVLKRMKPGASLAAILSGGPVYRVPGLRRAGGIKLHNVGPKQK